MDQFSLLTCRSARNRRDVPTTSLLITQAPRDQPTGGAVNERGPRAASCAIWRNGPWQSRHHGARASPRFAISFPLRRRSVIATPEMASYLLTRSEGTIGLPGAAGHDLW